MVVFYSNTNTMKILHNSPSYTIDTDTRIVQIIISCTTVTQLVNASRLINNGIRINRINNSKEMHHILILRLFEIINT